MQAYWADDESKQVPLTAEKEDRRHIWEADVSHASIPAREIGGFGVELCDMV